MIKWVNSCWWKGRFGQTKGRKFGLYDDDQPGSCRYFFATRISTLV